MPKVIKRGSAPPPSSPRGLPSKKRIIEREVVGATREAAEIRRRAELEAQRIVDEAKEQAYETRQHGYAEGREEALAEFTQQTAAALQQLKQLEARVEPEYIALVRDCCEKVLGQELTLNPEAIVELVRTVLKSARQQREIIVRLNPQDVPILERSKGRLMQVLARASEVQLREDPLIDRGGCQVMTELGSIDASLERQLDALGAALGAELNEAGLDYEDDYDEGDYA